MSNWNYRTVRIPHKQGFGENEHDIRTDGTSFFLKKTVQPDSYTSLKSYVDELTKLLNEHPDAEVSREHARYDDDMYTTVTWWEPLPDDSPIVEKAKADIVKDAEQRREHEERELERLKKARPDLFP